MNEQKRAWSGRRGLKATTEGNGRGPEAERCNARPPACVCHPRRKQGGGSGKAGSSQTAAQVCRHAEEVRTTPQHQSWQAAAEQCASRAQALSSSTTAACSFISATSPAVLPSAFLMALSAPLQATAGRADKAMEVGSTGAHVAGRTRKGALFGPPQGRTADVAHGVRASLPTKGPPVPSTQHPALLTSPAAAWRPPGCRSRQRSAARCSRWRPRRSRRRPPPAAPGWRVGRRIAGQGGQTHSRPGIGVVEPECRLRHGAPPVDNAPQPFGESGTPTRKRVQLRVTSGNKQAVVGTAGPSNPHPTPPHPIPPRHHRHQ